MAGKWLGSGGKVSYKWQDKGLEKVRKSLEKA